MKDIDFDELDRAVASALSSSRAPSNAAPADDTPLRDVGEQTPVVNETVAPDEPSAPLVETNIDTIPDADISSVDEPVRSISAHSVHARITPSTESPRSALLRQSPVTAQKSDDEAQQLPQETSAPLAISKRTIPHRAGRFMDMVPTSQKPLRTTVARTGVVIQPASSSDVSSVPRPVAPVPRVQPTLAPLTMRGPLIGGGREPVVNRIDNTTPPATSAPEQFSFNTLESASVSTSMDSQQDEQLAAALVAPIATEPIAAVSPFLPGAKVEKRPLGGLETSDDVLTDDFSLSSDVASSESLDEQVDTDEAHMPAELQNDLAAIDSQEAGPVSEVETTPPREDTIAFTPTQQLGHSGPTSITRQYKEQPRIASEDDESGSIFDPQTYEPPVEHPAHKSSGWGWVIAIAIIIVLATLAAVVAWMEGVLPVPL